MIFNSSIVLRELFWNIQAAAYSLVDLHAEKPPQIFLFATHISRFLHLFIGYILTNRAFYKWPRKRLFFQKIEFEK